MRAPNRAFVVEVDAEARIALGQLHGRIEHVISGACDDFDSAAALIGFIERVLLPREPAGGEGETGR